LDFNKTNGYQSQNKLPQTIVVDMRTDSAKKFRKIPKGLGYYLGDSQTIPSRADLFNAYLVSENANLPFKSIRLINFDILLVEDSQTPGNFDEFVGSMGECVVEGATIGLVAGAANRIAGIPVNPNSTSVVIGNSQMSQNYSKRVTYTVIVDIETECNGNRVHVINHFKFNPFVFDDAAEVRDVAYKGLMGTFSDFVMQYKK
jgi:hypothetical protein